MEARILYLNLLAYENLSLLRCLVTPRAGSGTGSYRFRYRSVPVRYRSDSIPVRTTTGRGNGTKAGYITGYYRFRFTGTVRIVPENVVQIVYLEP